jgi:MFS family permease
VSTPNGSLRRHPDFRRFWTGQTLSFFGSEVTLLALPLTAVVTLDASGVQMGLLAAAGTAPALAVGLFAGALIDRTRRRPILIAADFGRAAILGSVPAVYLLDWLSIWYLCLAAFLTGVLTTFFDVAHASFLPSIVRREQLVEGNSKLEFSRSGAMILGPGLAGLIVQVFTAPIAILIDAVSFVLSAFALGRIRTVETRPHHSGPRHSLLADVREGIGVIALSPLLRTMGSSLGVYNLFSGMFSAVYLLFVTRELDVPPAALGIIFGVGALGFPVAALAARWVADRIGIGPAIVWGAFVNDAAFLLVPLATGPVVVAVAMLTVARIVATLGGPVTAINQISLRQAITPDRLLGRVNGTMRVVTLGLAPVGALAGGFLGDLIGLRPTLIVGAVGLQIGFAILYLSPVRALKEVPDIMPDPGVAPA